MNTNLKCVRREKRGQGAVERGCILDACDATAKAEQVEEVGHGGDLLVDVGNMEDAPRPAEFHHWRHITERL